MPMKISKADEKVFNDLADKAATACRDLRDFITETILDPRTDEISDWSEKKLESDKGQAARSWLDEWETFRDDLPEFDEWPAMDPEG
jgi:hypothetical protein